MAREDLGDAMNPDRFKGCLQRLRLFKALLERRAKRALAFGRDEEHRLIIHDEEAGAWEDLEERARDVSDSAEIDAEAVEPEAEDAAVAEAALDLLKNLKRIRRARVGEPGVTRLP